MRGFRGGFRARKRRFATKRWVIKRFSSKVHHRVDVRAATVATGANAYFNILHPIEDPSEENITTAAIGTDTGPCQCEIGSRLLGGKLNFIATGGSAGQIVEVMMWVDKKDVVSDTITPTTGIFTEADSLELRHFRGLRAYYNRFVFSTSSDKCRMVIKIPKRMKQFLQEGSRVKLGVFNGTGSTLTFYIWGKTISQHA